MTVHENYYREVWAEHDEIRATVRKMVKEWGLKIATRGGYWQIHNDPWYTLIHNPVIQIVHMGFRLVPKVSVCDRDYMDLAQQIADYLDLKFGNKEEMKCQQ